jgi:DNA-binding CsgD family transcriptional regulator
MPQQLTLAEADVRSIVRLLGDTCAHRGTINQKKKVLMQGLCHLIDVQAWAWVHAVQMIPEQLPVYVAFTHDGFTEEQIPAFLKIQTHPDMAKMSAPLCHELKGRTEPLTRTLQQIIPIPSFVRTEVAQDWRACGFYPRVLFFFPLMDGTFSGIGIYRTCEKPLLTQRQARIAHILLSEVPWLHEAHGAHAERAEMIPQLPVRQRLVLELLLQNYDRKTIADSMRISIHTVSGYVRDIYRFFGVSSHTQLVKRFFLGNGGDFS